MRLNECQFELFETYLSGERLVDGKELLLGLCHEVVVTQREQLAKNKHAQMLKVGESLVLQ